MKYNDSPRAVIYNNDEHENFEFSNSPTSPIHTTTDCALSDVSCSMKLDDYMRAEGELNTTIWWNKNLGGACYEYAIPPIYITILIALFHVLQIFLLNFY